MAKILLKPPNYRTLNFPISKVLAKIKENSRAGKSDIYVYFKSDNYRKGNKGEKQRKYYKNKAKKVKSNREKSNIAIVILEKLLIR